MSPTERLQDALNEEDPALAAEAIRLGADVNAMWEEEVLLTTAVQLATADILKLLLDAGADPNRKNLDGTTPLTWCPLVERIELLLDAGASARFELHRPLFHSSLHGAAEAGDLARLRLLLERGEAACLLPEFFQMLAWTPLHCAVHEGHLDAARFLIAAGSDPNRFDDDLGYTAISLAAGNNDVEMVRLLLELGADPVAKDDRGNTPLNQAAKADEIGQLLIAAGASPQEQSANRFQSATPIFNVANVAASIDYYVNKLGFRVEWDWGSPPTFASVERDAVRIFLCQGGQGAPGTWLSIYVQDVDALYEEYRRSGAIIRQPPANFPWGVREMNVQDLDGHRLRMGADAMGPSDGVDLLEAP